MIIIVKHGGSDHEDQLFMYFQHENFGCKDNRPNKINSMFQNDTVLCPS